MSKFKVGDKVVITSKTNCYNGKFNIGDSGVIQRFQHDEGHHVVLREDFAYGDHGTCWHSVSKIKLLKPKWTIYNNELKWSELSDKQKGKMLLAAHSGLLFGGTTKPTFNNNSHPYQAVKPTPTMAELFLADWLSTSGDSGCSQQMIDKGWVKK